VFKDAEDFEIKIPSNIKSNWEDEEVLVEKAPEPVIRVDKVKEKVKKIDNEEKQPIEVKELTEEEKKAAQEEADLKNSLALMGLDKSLDEISFDTKDDVNNYIDRLYARLNKYNSNEHYFDFLDGFLKSLSRNRKLKKRSSSD
jgi:tRNA C32,U32 (ribose-2'-O)-methylase TrmJ